MDEDAGIGKLTLAIVEALKNKGLNQSEIAEVYGVTRQYVSWIKYTYGGKLTPREVVLKTEWPFDVPTELTQTSPYRNLRNHAEYVITGGKGMSEDSLKRLKAFHDKLRDENVVVEFDPNIPPIPGVSNKGGWAFRGRLPKDGDLLLRVNKHTRITEEGRRIWRLPPIEP